MKDLHEEKLSQYKNKYCLCTPIKTACVMIGSLLLLGGCASFLGNATLNILMLILGILTVGMAFVIVKYQTRLGDAADRYVSLNLLRPIIAEKVEISSFEPTGVISHKKLLNASIFPNDKKIMGKNHFCGILGEKNIEYFDFVSYESYGLYGNMSYDKKGSFAIITTNRSFPGRLTVKPKAVLQEKVDKVFAKILRSKTPEIFVSGNKEMDSQYAITTNCPEYADRLVDLEFIERMLKYKDDKNHSIYLEFCENNIYIFLEDNVWQWKMGGERNDAKYTENEKVKYMENVNALWGAKSASEINDRLRKNWSIMTQLYDICVNCKWG